MREGGREGGGRAADHSMALLLSLSLSWRKEGGSRGEGWQNELGGGEAAAIAAEEKENVVAERVRWMGLSVSLLSLS